LETLLLHFLFTTTEYIIGLLKLLIRSNEVKMKNIKMILVTLAMAASVNSYAIGTAVSVSSAWDKPASGTYALPSSPSTSTTTSTSTNPVLSTVPQFNVKDVKVTADGKCQIVKNGAVIKTDVYAGSPCQKIYGTGIQAASSSSTSVNSLPESYREPDFNTLQEYSTQPLTGYGY